MNRPRPEFGKSIFSLENFSTERQGIKRMLGNLAFRLPSSLSGPEHKIFSFLINIGQISVIRADKISDQTGPEGVEIDQEPYPSEEMLEGKDRLVKRAERGAISPSEADAFLGELEQNGFELLPDGLSAVYKSEQEIIALPFYSSLAARKRLAKRI